MLFSGLFISIEIHGRRSDSMRIRSLSLVLLGVLAAVGLSSCQQPYHQPEEHYIFIASNINVPYWQEAQAGLTDAAKQLGVKAEFDGPDKFDPQEELSAFQKAVALKPSGILISASRPELFHDAINAAIIVGVPVIAVDSDAPDTKRVLFIGTDNFRAGQESGKRMAQILKGQGRIAIVSIPGQLNL